MRPDRETPGQPAKPVGPASRLRPVKDGVPGERPTGADGGDRVVHWQRAGRFLEETVAALAELLFGERRLERLDDREADELAMSLEPAVRGRVMQQTLAGAISRLSTRDDRGEAANALWAWLIKEANARELLGRRRAA